ncbi:hypothetical protein F0P96_18365 [Hymenobacter busanensis]|uniref:Uncharacterized protein n=1 Tax=Hymenobacter busanensis TaxID=2607656 RepID=A0A7L4ZSI4_9BACT|nr:C25 family cysteine peptidase [Hymenobacter busanensis]KAA9327200.1 hypothetical protein F0P96_18365 [Hymenobacter busanensis]QHJ05867.1 hypothetical protein GUY19_00570 [Hymenobacter busanensis]
MKQVYHRLRLGLAALVGAVGLTMSALPMVAQSGPYGNEWINYSQQYAKIPVLKDGIYRLDYQYLQQAGVPAGLNPARLQLFRRGREVAIHLGGNTASVDATSYVEFYGQRNDGQLDREMYKDPNLHVNKILSQYTDTAAYFLTWNTATSGNKRMATVNQTLPNVPTQPYRLATRTIMFPYAGQTNGGNQSGGDGGGDPNAESFYPWFDRGEGFASPLRGYVNSAETSPGVAFVVDSLVNVEPNGAVPRISIMVHGLSYMQHNVKLQVRQPNGTIRQLGNVVTIDTHEGRIFNLPLERNDISADGKVQVLVTTAPVFPLPTNDLLTVGFIRVTYAQTMQWVTGSSNAFQNDSTLTTAVTSFELNNAPAQTVGYDVTNPFAVSRYPGQPVAAGRQLLVFSTTALPTTHRYHVADATLPLKPAGPRRVRFRNISPAAHNFFIITSEVLMKPAGSVANPVRAYATYRASAAGGRYDTLVVTSQQLYDQFHYGEKSALGIRHFALWMVANNTRQKYMLLLGKGLETHSRARDAAGVEFVYRTNAARSTTPDLVPPSSRATSDIFFSARWDQSNYIPQIATGRVMAQTPQQVINYLDKLKEHETPLASQQAWRKNLLHLSGGETTVEQSEFLGYVNQYKAYAERPCFAGKVVKTYSRTTIGTYTSLPVTIDISPELNAGVAMITYFGHGSNTAFDLNLGDPNSYNNGGKYPVMFYNGCAGGRSFVPGLTTAEEWTLAQGKGAIGFLASSDFGYGPQLHKYSTELYRTLFNDPAWYGKPIAVVQAEVARRVLQYFGNNDRIAIISAMSTTWQGDPALKLYSPEKPDLAITAGNISVEPIAPATGTVLATTANFNLRVPLQQTGSACYGDSLYVRVTRNFGKPGVADEVTLFPMLAPQRDTVLLLTLRNLDATKVFGQNSFRIDVDPANKIDELSETNNSATINYTFLQGGVTLLAPNNFSIVGKTDVRLVAQSNLAQTQARIYQFELDTASTFTTPLMQRQVSATDVAEWRPGLPTPTAGRDSVVYYWRVRFDPATVQPNENGNWVTSSFRLIRNSQGGWSQSHYGQFASATKTGIVQNAPSGKWEFPEQQRSLLLRTIGGGAGTTATFQTATHGIISNNTPVSALCGVTAPNLLVAVFNPTTLEGQSSLPGGNFQTCGQGTDTYFFFSGTGNDNINAAARQAQLTTLLQNVPAGYYVAIVSANRVAFSTLSAALKAELTALGSQKIGTLQDGDPYVLLAQKGNPAAAQERTADPASSTPRNAQDVALTQALRVRGVAGTIISPRIGPAQQWQTLYHTVKLPDATDHYRLQLIGYDKTTNAPTVLDPNVTSRALPLNVSATQYPYLALQVMVWDSVNRTAPQLKQWLITYKGVPEGVVRRDKAQPNDYAPAQLSAQVASTGLLTFPVYFENVSTEDFPDKVTARASVQMADNSTIAPVELVSARALKSDSTVMYRFSLDVRRLKGDGRVRVEVNPGLLPEQFYFNNELNLTFTAPNINLPPTVDVAFDGTRILNGDIVSPNPEILVDVKYEDKRNPLDDPNKIELYLTRPGQAPEKVLMTGGNISFAVDKDAGRAKVLYRPGSLENGVYKLEAQATDMAGNAAAGQRYAVTFTVVKESTISNFYPYPNPITSKARFVFTLTGSELPRNLKIQIMTLTGKVVREIMQSELGPLRIGNNITEFAWNGTDEYGDRLANGTYLYRVLLDDPDGTFKQRNTAADWSFKKNWGKLVLLR